MDKAASHHDIRMMSGMSGRTFSVSVSGIESSAFFCYFVQFLDKVVRVVRYTVAEFPQGIALQKFPISKLLGCNVMCWGVLLACSATTKNFAAMVALRCLLGAFESIIVPALILITSQWYTKRQACARIGIWYCGAGVGQIVGGLISFASQHASKTSSFEGWHIMMVAVGASNILVALGVLLCLPDSVERASFLSASEKAQVQQTLALDQAGNWPRVFNRVGLLEALKDPAIWFLSLGTLFAPIPSGVVTTFSVTLLAGMGYSSKQAALLNMGSGLVSTFATLASTFAILLNVSRWLSIVLLLTTTLIGATLMNFLSHHRSVGLVGVYLVNFCVAPTALLYALVQANTKGYTKRVTANAMMQVGFSIGNIIGPQTFQARETPGYLSAKITVMAANAGAISIAILLRLLYGHRNKRRDRENMAHYRYGVQTRDNMEDLTDLTDSSFRYVY